MLVRVVVLLSSLFLSPCLGDPLAKEVIRAMDEVISDHVEWDNWDKWSEIMAEYFTEDMIYDTNWSPDNTMNNSTGIQAWWDAEHIPYNLAFDNTTFNQVRGHFFSTHTHEMVFSLSLLLKRQLPPPQPMPTPGGRDHFVQWSLAMI